MVAASPALAGGTLPSGGQVVAGQAAINSAPHGVVVNQSTSHAIINWQDFSIGAGNAVQFNNGSGATLNRVTGGNLSQIDGVLSATGSLYLINPQGVVIGAGGKVVTGGNFIASTRDVDNDAFLNGDPLHAKGNSNGNVVNQGSVTSRFGDTILIGKSVNNSGTVSAKKGTAALVAGDDVLLRPLNGDARISVAAGSGDVTNTGAIAAAQAELNAAGGNVYAIVGNKGGIAATGTATINGQVWLTAGGVTEVSGAISAKNADGSGGTAIITGNTVAIDAGANISASGTHGGTVLIGGDQAGGSDPSRKLVAAPVATAQTTSVAAGAKISADGSKGQGGSVVVWSDNYTSYNGAISARGAGQASGGFAEVSSHGVLDFEGTADLLSDAGATGTLLLDPNNLTITTSGTDNDTSSSSGGTTTLAANANPSNLKAATITGLLTTTNVAVTATGTIKVNATINWSANTNLTLDAGGALTIGSGSAGSITNTTSTAAILTLKSGGAITESGSSNVIKIANLVILPDAGTVQSVTLNNNNTVTNLAANVASLSFKNSGALTIASIAGTNGITATGALTLNVGSTISDSAAPVSVGSFILNNGNWSQNQASLPSFTATTSFAINGGSFLRVTGGDGSVATPYQIADVYGLQGLTNVAGSQNAVLANDIDASSTATWNSGAGFVPFFTYADTFDGQNHTITGLTISQSSTTEVGLFTVNNGTIKNLNLSGGSVTGGNYTGFLVGINGLNNSSALISNVTSSGNVSSSQSALGGLVGENDGTIANSSSSGNVTGDTSASRGVGGLVGSNGGTISGSSASGAVTGNNTLGGLAGQNGYTGQSGTGTITGSHASGTVTAPYTAGEPSDAGGLVGQNLGTIDTSYASGNVVGDMTGCCGSDSDFGGLAGLNLGAITNSHASGNVTGLVSAGGLVGTNGGYNNGTPQGGTIDNSYYELGTVTGLGDTGGLVGSNGLNGSTLASTITNSHTASTATVNGTRSAGGLVGSNYGGTTIADSFSDAAVNGVLSSGDQIYGVGGFVGANDGTIRNSHATGAVTTVNASYYVGGFAGTAYGTTTNSYATGNVTAGNYVGGFAGDIAGNTSGSYATGDVFLYGGDGGGFVGIAEGALSNDHASGTVRAGAAAQSLYGYSAAGGMGGFAGLISAGTVTNSYATGDVIGYDGSDGVNYSSSLGGFAGSNEATISQSYATGSVTGWTTVGGLVAVNYGTISGSYATGAVTSGMWYGEPVSAGGLVGENAGTITGSYASGDVSSPQDDPNGYYDFGVGGLVGDNGFNQGGTLYTGTIANSYATGKVSGTLAVGGLVGSTTGGSITDSYATGDVSGWAMVGGLVGENELGSITNTYAVGSVTASQYEGGGLVGSNGEYGDGVYDGYGSGTITASYWNTDVNPGLPGLGWDSGSHTSVTGLTTAQMLDGANQATNFAGFDFTNTWSPAGNGYYPQLYGVSYVVKVIAGGGTVQYGDAITSALTFHSLQNGDLASSITGLSITGASQGTGVGTYAISATGASLTSSSGDAYRFIYEDGNITITQRQLTLALTGSTSKSYDGTTAATLTAANYGGALGNIYNGDDVSLASLPTSGSYSDKNAGSNKIVTVSNMQLTGADALNYALSASGAIGTITPAVLTDSLTGTVSKTYDGTAAATLTAGNFGTLGGVIGTEDVTLDTSLAIANYDTANAGSGKTVNLTGAQLTGADALNYTIGTISGAGIGNIDKATVTASLSGFSCICKIYNGNTNATVVANDLIVSGLTGVDDTVLNVIGSTYSSKNVSSNLGLTINLSLTGTSSSNYIFNTPTILASGGQIAAKTISLNNTLTGSVTKVYDATTAATLAQSNYNVNGTIVSGDDVSINGTAVYNVATAGSSIKVTASGLTLSGADKDNYVLSRTSVTGNSTIGTITKATLTYTANSASRLYGASNPSFSGTVTGFVGGQTQTATTGTLAFTTTATSSSSVASYAINGSGLSATNYVFVQAAGNATAFTINPATLTYTATAANRLYGATDPSFTGTVTGFVLSQTQATATTGTLAFTTAATQSSNAGNYALNGSGLTANSGNYIFVQAAANATRFTINPATLTYTATAASKIYGDLNPSFSGSVTGFVLGQTQGTATTGTLAFTTAATQSSNFGNYAVNGSGLTANSGNYVFVQAAGNGTAFNINPATLTYAATAASKIYGNLNPSFTGTVTGFVLGQTQGTATTGTLAFTTAATQSSNFGNYAVNGSGLTANSGNYVFVQAAGNGTAFTINAATLTYTATAASRLYGATDPSFTGTVTGFVLGQTQGTATTGTLAFNTTATSSSNVGSYAINGSGLTANNGNYVFAQAAGNAAAFAINPATLTYTATAASKLYGSSNPSVTGTVTGFVLGQTQGTATTGTLAFNTTATSSSAVGSYAINGSGLTANSSNYVFVQAAGNATAFAVNPATLTVTADALSKIYGASDPTLTYGQSGLVNGDTISVFTGSLSRAPGENVTSYTINQGSLSAGSNYTIAFTGASFIINPAGLTVTADSGLSKIYGASDPTLTYSASGLVNGDNAASVLSGALSRATGEHVLGGPYAINQGTLASNSNYTIAFVGADFTITPVSLTGSASIGGTTTKLYDGTADATGATVSGSVSGGISGDSITLDTSGLSLAYNDAHVAAANAIAAGGSAGFIITSSTNASQASDYDFSQPVIAAVAATITPVSLTGSASIGGTTTKLYDGTTDATGATVSGSVSGGISGDSIDLDISGLSLAYNSAHVAAANNIAASGSAGFIIASSTNASQASDYDFSQPVIASVAASITPASLIGSASIGGTTTKLYDGTTDATGATVSGSVSGGIGGDSIDLDTSAIALAYNSAHVATANKITATGVTGFIITASTNSSQASDYAFAQQAIASVTASITPAALQVTANSGQSKVYGASDPTLTYSFSGLKGGDTAALFLGSLSRAAGETVAGGPYVIALGTLSAGSDYNIALTSAGFRITPAALVITADNITAASLGEAQPTASVAGFVRGDTSAVVQGLQFGIFPITGTDITFDVLPFGATAANYSITNIAGTLILNPPSTQSQPPTPQLFIAPPPTGTASGQVIINGVQVIAFSNVATAAIGDSSSVLLFQIGLPGTITGMASIVLTDYSNTVDEDDRLVAAQ